MGSEPISYLSLKDHVYQYISEMIGDGSLRPNEKVNEQQIIDSLEVSRTPVREALIELATEGYLEKLPRRGFIVKPVDVKKAKEIYQIIGVLDGLAASKACDLLTEQDIAKMKRMVHEMDAAIERNSYDDYYDQQILFHRVYIDKCENDELKRIIGLLKKSFLRKSYRIQDDGEMFDILKNTNHEHKEMTTLFELKDNTSLDHYMKNVHWSCERSFYDSIE